MITGVECDRCGADIDIRIAPPNLEVGIVDETAQALFIGSVVIRRIADEGRTTHVADLCETCYRNYVHDVATMLLEGMSARTETVQ